jgi:hypothetical protein
MATDAEIRAAGLYAVPKNKYLQNEFQLPTNEVVEEETESFGIPQTQAFTNSGGNNYTGSYNFGNTGFQQAVDARQNRLNKPTDTSTFMGRTMGKVRDFIEPQSASQIMADGYQEPRFQPGIIGTMMGKMDNYRNLPRADQAFISSQMGYTGPTIFGENNSGLGKDEFGINTRSAFGNYAEYVDKMNKDSKDMTDEEFKNYVNTFKGLERRKKIAYREKSKIRQDLQKESLAGQIQRDAEAGAAGKSDPQDKSRAGSLGRRPGSGGNVTATAANTNKETGTTYDSGGREGFGYGLKDGGRIGYFFGGRVNYKVGGRTDAGANRTTASKVGVGQINESGQKVSGGDYNNNNDGGVTKPVFYDKNDNIITTDFISKDPNLTINYTDPKNYASLKSKIGFNNILDNDDITAEGYLTGKFGPVSYNTNFTDKGITGTNLTAGKFNANLNPDMQVQNIGYSNNINGINYGVNTDFDNTMFTAGVNFKNGGLAGLL